MVRPKCREPKYPRSNGPDVISQQRQEEADVNFMPAEVELALLYEMDAKGRQG